MLNLITSKSEISRCQSLLLEALKSSLPNKGNYTIGYHSGSIVSQVYSNSDIWFSPALVHSKDERYWNGFGLSKNLSETKSNSITVEINILQNGVNGRVAGAFAKDDKTGAVYLTHSGKVGGGRKGIGKNSFIKWYKIPPKNIARNDNKSLQAIIIGDISSKSFTKELTKFIKNVESFKELAAAGEINEAILLSDKELEQKVLASTRKPKKYKSSVTVYERNKYIVELAKRKAKGICQLCLKKAPFNNKSGQPYLETHHIVWLSKKGSDTMDNTVALCPNCHKKMHIINSKSDIKILKSATKNLTNSSSG